MITHLRFFNDMTSPFQHIGLITKRLNQEIAESISNVLDILKSRSCLISVEEKTANLLPHHSFKTLPYDQIGTLCDLVIVIGGDGSLLHAARTVVIHNTPIIGINRGSLGFLTDIKPSEIKQKLNRILDGEYREEQRFLLKAKITSESNVINECIALNEITILPRQLVKMIEFEIRVNDEFMCSQRSDGLIVATPTGSTAYALSAGGPILYPSLNAMVMVPMFPHTLTNRPVVIHGDQIVQVAIVKDHGAPLCVNSDNQVSLNLSRDHIVFIQKFDKPLRLLHPLDYNYFETLRSKLDWGKKQLHNEE